MRQKLAILMILNLCFLIPAQPAMAAGLLNGPTAKFNLAMFTLGSIGFSLVAHYMYKNSPAQRTKGYDEEMGLGEWYFGGYLGLSYLPSFDWGLSRAAAPNNGRTAKNIVFQPGPQVGVKFGRFFETLPWFGLEVETSFSRNSHRAQNISLTPALPNVKNSFLYTTDWFMAWAMQINMLARHGFLKDKEVPFGRLQPYIGLGPGFEVVYGKTDSAKNFAIEAQAGLRYMCTENVGIFVEYKFSYQFRVEYEQVLIAPQRPATMTFDLPHHRFVVGVTYHFKNLYGN